MEPTQTAEPLTSSPDPDELQMSLDDAATTAQRGVTMRDSHVPTEVLLGHIRQASEGVFRLALLHALEHAAVERRWVTATGLAREVARSLLQIENARRVPRRWRERVRRLLAAAGHVERRRGEGFDPAGPAAARLRGLRAPLVAE